METENQSDDALLDDVQRETFAYFLHEVNERNGLVADCTRPGWPCSIAATGFGLASYPGWRGARLDDARQCGCANARGAAVLLRQRAGHYARSDRLIAMADRAAGDGIG